MPRPLVSIDSPRRRTQGRPTVSCRVTPEVRRVLERELARDPSFNTLSDVMEWFIVKGIEVCGAFEEGAPDEEAMGYAAGLRQARELAISRIQAVIRDLSTEG